MDLKIIVVLLVLGIISAIPSITAQEVTDATHELVKATIKNDSQISVMHEIREDSRTVGIKTLDGDVSNIKVAYVDGGDVDYTVDNNIILIDAPAQNVMIQYDLTGAIAEVNGYQTWIINYPETVRLDFPNDVKLVFVNDALILLDGSLINCHGCSAKIEYSTDESVITENASWEDQEFTVTIRTISEITSFVFDQPTKRISFDVEADKFITMSIPLELLWEPYEVRMGEEKIQTQRISSDDTQALISFRTADSGTVDIIGTSVVPEFPVLIIPLVIGITMIIALQTKSRITLR